MSTQSVKMMYAERGEYYRIANETIPRYKTFQEWNDMMIKKAHLFQLLYEDHISEFSILNAETWTNHPSNKIESLS